MGRTCSLYTVGCFLHFPGEPFCSSKERHDSPIIKGYLQRKNSPFFGCFFGERWCGCGCAALCGETSAGRPVFALHSRNKTNLTKRFEELLREAEMLARESLEQRLLPSSLSCFHTKSRRLKEKRVRSRCDAEGWTRLRVLTDADVARSGTVKL